MVGPTALWVVPVADVGGVARHVADVARAGIPGYRTAVLCPPGPLADRLADAEVDLLVRPFGPRAGLVAGLRAVRAAVREVRPVVIHSHLSYADIVVAMAAPRRTRLVSTEHGIAADDLVYHGSVAKARLMSWVHRARCARFSVLIAVSEATAAAMARKWHVRRPVVVIRNGIDRAPVHTRAAGLKVLSLSRLAPEKRIAEAIDAVGVLAANGHPEVRLTVAGEGAELGALRAHVAGAGLGERVRFAGSVDARAALDSHDVLVQLSVWENCSYSVLDAAAGGVGVVATDVGGNPEIVGRQCLVADLDATGIAERIMAQGLHPGLRPGIAAAWPTVAEMAGQIAAVYRQVSS